ncbi:DUF6509 family protein [Bacillus salitolerans]|uniref:DUF6509 family protein n=1 Tax=Bacillus salitolerans TaxID=1437434 RepID=A0ABW4LWE5_9BACI
MFTIHDYSVEEIKDPTGILAGHRFEYILNLEVDEEDELFLDDGVSLRVILAVEGNHARISQYTFHNRSTNAYLDFGLEEDEEEMILSFCMEHISEAE